MHRSGPARAELERLARELGVPLREAVGGVRYCGDFHGQTGDGAPFPEAITAKALLGLIARLEPGVTELACHPGEPEDLDSVCRAERALELEALCDPRVRRAVREAGVRLCSFADLREERAGEPVPVLRPITTHREHRLESEEAFTFVVAGESRPTLPRMPWSAITLQVMREKHDGVRYVTSGGGGAPLYAPPDRGGFAHYLLVSVGPDGIDHAVIEPFHLEVEAVAGHDGLRLASTLRVANTTDRDLTLRNLELRCPRLASPAGYRLEVDFSDYAREPTRTRARIAEVEDAGDGSATVRVEADVPTGTAFHLTVHADLDGPAGARGG